MSDDTNDDKPKLTVIDGGAPKGADPAGAKPRGHASKVASGIVAGALQRIDRRAGKDIPDPARGQKRDGVPPGKWTPDADGLPPDCPVKPLGVDGRVFYMVDAMGQLFAVGGDHGAFGQEAIRAAFAGRIDYLYWAFPQWSAAGDVNGIKANWVQDVMFDACARRGLWTPADRVRGRGAWAEGPAEASRLIYHCGDHLWSDGKTAETGARASYFYPRAVPLPGPWPEAIDDAMNPVGELVDMFRQWDWSRPHIDPLIMTGWVMAAVVAGALPWRPSIWVVSDAGAGKSTLQMMVREVLDQLVLIAENTTAAGIYQTLKNDARPVSLDETEYDPDQGRRIQDLVSLARIAASGGTMRRGGSDHAATQFTARSVFFFSSINLPPLPPQDLSRMAVLRLKPLEAGRAPVKAPRMMETILPRLMRRLADRWREFPALFAAYRQAFYEEGHSQRSQDTNGVFLALAHLALGDEGMERAGYRVDDLRGFACEIGHEAKPKPNWRAAIDHLLSRPIEAFRGGSRQTVGQVLFRLHNGDRSDVEPLSEQQAADLLAAAGLGLKRVEADNLADGWWLAVPNGGLVSELFKGSIWQAGPTGAAGFTEAIRQGPPTVVCFDKEINRARVAGLPCRCTLVKWLELDALE
jgi:hypothetical protein